MEKKKEKKKKENANQGVAPDAMKPSAAVQDPPSEKEAPKKMEIVLASLPLVPKADQTNKGLEASEAASTQPVKGPLEEKIIIKKK